MGGGAHNSFAGVSFTRLQLMEMSLYYRARGDANFMKNQKRFKTLWARTWSVPVVAMAAQELSLTLITAFLKLTW